MRTQHIYSHGQVINFDSLDGPLILQILIAADELDLDSLLKRVDDYLIYKHADFLRQDPGQILQIIFKYEPCSKFRDLCLKTICESPEILFNISLLKDLLLDLIPLIKWLEISSTAFWRYVIPYKKIFPKDLLWAIIGCHLDPNDESITKSLPPRCLQSLPLFDSLIIGRKHLSIIASWLEKQDTNYFEKRKLSYSFSLIFRASQDGSSSDKFHNLCDNKGPILIISKIRQNGQIIGGYCPIDLKPGLNPRHNESWLASQDSFVFCLNINSNFNCIARVSDNQKAIYYNPNTCIGFGIQDMMLLSNNQIRSLSDSSYGNIKNVLPRGTHNLEDYEVFQVIKK
ncbi:18884_t:CDS:2 [Gigaspora rosea]|nr:18884_t:CDS:2 [Gigaspora rosea]